MGWKTERKRHEEDILADEPRHGPSRASPGTSSLHPGAFFGWLAALLAVNRPHPPVPIVARPFPASSQLRGSSAPVSTEEYLRGNRDYDADLVWSSLNADAQRACETRRLARGPSTADGGCRQNGDQAGGDLVHRQQGRSRTARASSSIWSASATGADPILTTSRTCLHSTAMARSPRSSKGRMKRMTTNVAQEETRMSTQDKSLEDT